MFDYTLLSVSDAPVPGLEPGTHGLTVRCSNQLSYTGIKFVNEYTTLFKNEKSNFIFLFNFMI